MSQVDSVINSIEHSLIIILPTTGDRLATHPHRGAKALSLILISRLPEILIMLSVSIRQYSICACLLESNWGRAMKISRDAWRPPDQTVSEGWI